MKKLKRLSERCLALFTALVMCMSLVQATAFAGENTAGYTPGTLCEHHTEHTADCGYHEAKDAVPCGHVQHDAACGYIEAVEGSPCTCGATADENGIVTHTEGCGYVAAVEGVPCGHLHDAACGYAEAVEASPCRFDCQVCRAAAEQPVNACTKAEDCTAEKHEEGCPKLLPLKCICETKCGEDSVNAECPVCGAENADLTACKGEEVPAEVPAQVQEFLGAVAALPAPEDIPEEATAEEIEALRALFDACNTAYDALLPEDLAREDVNAAIETMYTATKKFAAIQLLEATEGVTWDAETQTLTAIGDGMETLTAEMLTEKVGADYKDKVKHLDVDGYSIEKQLFHTLRTAGNVQHPSALESVQLNNVKEIGAIAFQDSIYLTDFTLSNSDESIVTKIRSAAFADTGIAGEFTLNNAELQSMNTFARCNALTEVTLNNCSVSDYAFDNCDVLTKATLNGCDVTGMYVFTGCDSLTEINLTGSSNVTGNEAFSGITNLSSFSMTGGKLNAAQILYYDPNLTSVELTSVLLEGKVNGSQHWSVLNGIRRGGEPDKLTITINGGTLTKGCLNYTVADKIILNNVEIPDDIWPFYGTNSQKLGTKLTVNGGSIGSYGLQWVGFETIELNNVSPVGIKGLACNSTTLKTLILNNTNIDGTYPLSDWREGVRGDTLTVVAESDDCYLGINAFWGAKYSNVVLQNVNNVGTYAFNQNTVLQSIKFENTDGKKTSIGDANTSCYTFQDCTSLTTIEGIEHLSLVGGRAFEGCTNLSQDFITDLANSDVILGYSSIFKGNAAMEARMKGILGGKFNLDLVPKAEELKPEGWTSNKTGEKNSTEPDSNQITKEAKWHDADKTVADVQLQFSHSDKPGMDFLFILDLSDSMARIGNGDKDSDSRFYSMQSKMIDVVSKIVEADKAPGEKQYNNKVAFVTFGGTTSKDVDNGHIYPTNEVTSDVFTSDPSVVAEFAGLQALGQNTDYHKAFDKATEIISHHDSSRKLAVIFLSDGRPTVDYKLVGNLSYVSSKNGQLNVNGREKTIADTAAIARSWNNVEVFGVLHSLPNQTEWEWAEKAMDAICTDKKYFKATDTDQFSEAVNKAIGAAYGTYTVVDQVGKDFDLDVNSIVAPEGTEVKVEGNTITWTIYGLPFTTYTLSFQEKLHDDLVNRVGTYTYDTNDGDATVNGDVNTVETPQLERTVNPNQYTVTVNYYLAGTTTPVPGTSPHTETLTDGDSYDVTAYDRISVSGYTYSSTEGALTGIMDGNKVINVYYTQTGTVYRYRIDHVYYTNGTQDGGTVIGAERRTQEFPSESLATEDDRVLTNGGNTYSYTNIISSEFVGNVYVITLRYDRTTTPTPGPDPDPTPVIPPVTPPVTPTPIPDNPTPLAPGTDGTTIPDQDVPLAAPGLNSVDHYAYIIGYPDGLVHPEANVTRAEVATIFFRLMTDEFRTEHWSTENAFSDVAVQEWFNNSVSTSAKAGIVKGYEDGTFRPNRNITRAEFAAIAARFLSDEVNITNSFSDISGHWAEDSINRAVMAGWIKGYPDGTFRPDQPITRAEAVTLINRMLDRTPDKDHLLEDMIRWDDNTEDKWYYADMQEATNSHDYERMEGDLIEDWTELLENRDWEKFHKEWSTAASALGEEVADNLDLSKIGENGAAQDAETAETANT